MTIREHITQVGAPIEWQADASGAVTVCVYEAPSPLSPAYPAQALISLGARGIEHHCANLDLAQIDRLIDQLYEARAVMVDAARSAGVEVPSSKVTDEQAVAIARAAMEKP